MHHSNARRLGAYQLLEEIGRGGMATVFKAYQPSMDRYVAIKVLSRHFTEDEAFLARFTREARTLARLEHPFILPVHDYGEQEGVIYLVMRYIGTGTLRDLLARQGPLELNETARIIDQVGRALGYAHSQGVVHRDVKPSNVLIDRRGDAFLTDFGIAKLMTGTSHFTATGATVGTPAYMSPEQGLAHPLDHRSDIYSLGVVLFEMTTGRVPFEAETPLAVLLQHVNAPLPPPRKIKTDLPEAVEWVICKALAKPPAERFQRAEEMVYALRRAVVGVPAETAFPRQGAQPDDASGPIQTASAPHPKPAIAAPVIGTRAAPSLRQFPWLPIAAGAVALVLVFVVVLLILLNLGDGEAPERATGPPLAGEIVLDNTDPEFAIEEGEWGTCWDGDCGGTCYGDDFLYAGPGCTSCRARFDFDIAAAGEYDVWAWWPKGDDRATDTPFTISYRGGPFVVNVDQRNNGNGWYRLGTLAFGAGESVRVVVAGTGTGYANADAIAITPAGSGPP